MSRITPGSWEPIKSYDGIRIIGIGAPGLQVEVCRFERDSVTRADARLMAAAPEMLEALEMVRDADEDCKKDGLTQMPILARQKIDAAIAKAEGK